MKAERHAVVEMCAGDRTVLDVLRVEYREMARIPALIVDRCQHVSFAFGRVGCARHEDGFPERTMLTRVVDPHRFAAVVEMTDSTMREIAGSPPPHAKNA
ncbi:MAG TPA: hypothetical protein VFJ95_10270 [Gammaproteobacteria bacterium]|nr:hypothetical protein [Gammaproteobacteria bacterium]